MLSSYSRRQKQDMNAAKNGKAQTQAREEVRCSATSPKRSFLVLHTFALLSIGFFGHTTARAQSDEAKPSSFDPTCQDPSLNQLVHPEGYKTAQLGTLGRAELVGHGPCDVVLIPGFGHGGEVFREFVELNGDRYRMLVVTPAGMEGTPAPPMPPPSESYGKRAWSSAFEKAVWDSIQRHSLKKPALIITGFFPILGLGKLSFCP